MSGSCFYCGRTGLAPGRFGLHIDHVIPRSKGGGNEWWNLVDACWRCNLKKGARRYPEAEEWMAVIRDRQERSWADSDAADFWAAYVDWELTQEDRRFDEIA